MKLRRYGFAAMFLCVISAVLIIGRNIHTAYAEETVSGNNPQMSASPKPVNNVVTGKTEGKTIKLLFIGNSHTYYNYMPYMVQGLAKGDGINCDITVVAANGYNLTRYANKSDPYGAMVYDVIRGGSWDYVVLQENRNKIIEKYSESESAFRALCGEIKKAGAKPVVYIPHADKTGNYFVINNKLIYLSSYQISEMMSRNNAAIANEFNMIIADYGLNCMRMMIKNPDINLYRSDLLHPSVNGSYLAACTIYSAIFNKNTYGNRYLPGSEGDSKYGLISGMKKNRAVLIQNIADARLSINVRNVEVKKGEGGKLNAELIISKNNKVLDGYDRNIYWSSDNSRAISINRITGEYTALEVGKHLVCAYTDSGLRAYTTIDVKQPSETFDIDQGNLLVITKGDYASYTYNIGPVDTTDSVTWSSDAPGVVSVDNNGNIYARSTGTATITAVTTSGLSASRYVRVKLKKPAQVDLQIKKSRKKRVSIEVTWKNNSNAVLYNIYRKNAENKKFRLVDTVAENKYTDRNMKRNKTYYYKIKAVHPDPKCNSDFSDVKKIEVKQRQKSNNAVNQNSQAA